MLPRSIYFPQYLQDRFCRLLSKLQADSDPKSDRCGLFRQRQWAEHSSGNAADHCLQNKYPEVYRDVVKTLKRHRLSILLDHRARWKNRLAALALFGGVAGLRFAFKFK